MLAALIQIVLLMLVLGPELPNIMVNHGRRGHRGIWRGREYAELSLFPSGETSPFARTLVVLLSEWNRGETGAVTLVGCEAVDARDARFGGGRAFMGRVVSHEMCATARKLLAPAARVLPRTRLSYLAGVDFIRDNTGDGPRRLSNCQGLFRGHLVDRDDYPP
jgi:hypothetical protein